MRHRKEHFGDLARSSQYTRHVLLSTIRKVRSMKTGREERRNMEGK